MNTVPPRPALNETPTFATALRVTNHVMRRYGLSSYLCWVTYADDSVGLHKFNRNGSHKRVEP